MVTDQGNLLFRLDGFGVVHRLLFLLRRRGGRGRQRGVEMVID